jgi:uncharacterized protein (TIGR03083 family)
MEFDRYIDSLRADATLLADTARQDLTLAVPPCPGWTVADVVEHLGYVYLHKIACMRLRRAPDPWPPELPSGDLIDWLESSLAELIAELTARGPAAPSHTWHAPDQTVGFWYRRMAQETAVHRVDVQLAFGPATPVDSDIALDGVDEILDIMLAGDWSAEPQSAPAQTIRLTAGTRAWDVRLAPTTVTVEHAPAIDAAGPELHGSADDILLWLWGRRERSALRLSGDPTAATALRDRLRLATQ